MYYITYKNILKENKNYEDFIAWIDKYWPMQTGWGALSVTIWSWPEQGRKVLFCRYLVKDIEHWNESAVGKDAEQLIKNLGEIISLEHICIKITRTKWAKNLLWERAVEDN